MSAAEGTPLHTSVPRRHPPTNSCTLGVLCSLRRGGEEMVPAEHGLCHNKTLTVSNVSDCCTNICIINHRHENER
jgi:hypothetical protein